MSAPRLAIVGGTASTRCDAEPAAPPQALMLTNCPRCNAELAMLRIIGGRGGAEYWTMRCVGCGGIHLDIVKGPAPAG